MKKTLIFSALLVALTLVPAIPAMAGTISHVAFTENCPVCSLNGGGTAVDMMKVFIDNPVAGVVFAPPGLNVYDIGWGASGWTETDTNPTLAQAFGPAMSAFNYILNFNIDNTLFPSTVTIGVDVYYYQNINGTETIIDQAALTYSGPTSFDPTGNNFGVDTTPLNPSEVPEPASMFLIGSALIGLAVRRYHKR